MHSTQILYGLHDLIKSYSISTYITASTVLILDTKILHSGLLKLMFLFYAHIELVLFLTI